MRMKDDERRLLGAAQAAGEFVMLPGISEDRCNIVLKNWALNGLIDLDSGRLTAKGRAARGGVVQQVQPIPVAIFGDVVDELIPLESVAVEIEELDDTDTVTDDEDSE